MKNRFTFLLCLAILLHAVDTAWSQSDYPVALTDLEVETWKVLQFGANTLSNPEFVPGKKNLLLTGGNRADNLVDIITKEVRINQNYTRNFWGKSGFSTQSNDPRWNKVQLVAWEPKGLIAVQGSDTVKIFDWSITYPYRGFSFNYPCLWLSAEGTLGERIPYQKCYCYDADKHAVTVQKFAIPVQASDHAFYGPVAHDAEHIWYYQPEEGLFAYHKKEGKTFQYRLNVPGNWDYTGVDSALIYFSDDRTDQMLCLNKIWLEQNRVPFDGSGIYAELVRFHALADSLEIESPVDLTAFMQKYNVLQNAFAGTKNSLIPLALQWFCYLFERELFDHPVLLQRSGEQLEGLEAQIPPFMLPVICEGFMHSRFNRGDLAGFLEMAQKAVSVQADYFQQHHLLWYPECIDSVQVIQEQLALFSKTGASPVAFLQKKALLLTALLQSGDCLNDFPGMRISNKKTNFFPAAYTYAELANRFPESAAARKAVCQVVEWGRAGHTFDREVYAALNKVQASPCALEATEAYFMALYYNFMDSRKTSLLKARELGQELLNKITDPGQQARIKEVLAEIRYELENNGND